MINVLFYIVCLIHVILWMFIMLAFLDKRTAYFNVYYLIPLIYIVHILPFHILMEIKYDIYEEDTSNKIREFDDTIVVPSIFAKLSNWFQKNSTFNPISPQGMMIFGLLTSIYVLYPIKYFGTED